MAFVLGYALYLKAIHAVRLRTIVSTRARSPSCYVVACCQRSDQRRDTFGPSAAPCYTAFRGRSIPDRARSRQLRQAASACISGTTSVL
jgi:hypothetical protein